MTVLERKTFLKKQIDLSDEDTLEKLENIIQNKKVILPQFVLADIEASKKQISNGEFLTEEEAEHDFEQWLNEG